MRTRIKIQRYDTLAQAHEFARSEGGHTILRGNSAGWVDPPLFDLLPPVYGSRACRVVPDHPSRATPITADARPNTGHARSEKMI
jgi:hypothetical protein